MKFLIQKIDKEIRHDFSFTLLESIRFQQWLSNSNDTKVKYLDYIETTDPDNIYPIQWKPMHRNYVPVGSVEFVSEFLGHFYGLTPKPMNVPEELFNFAGRKICNGNENDFHKGYEKLFVKSNDKIKGVSGIFNENEIDFPAGNYQISEVINIESEWRAFIYRGELVGLENYSGDFTMFPNLESILWMIQEFESAPVAYTLDVGVYDGNTFVIECHDFFSCGLYGFANHNILPFMHYRWFHEYLNKNK